VRNLSDHVAAEDHTAVLKVWSKRCADWTQGQVKVDLPGPGDQIRDALAAQVSQVPEWGSSAYENQQPRRLVTLMALLDTAPAVDDGEPFGVPSRREEVIQQNAAVVCIGSLMLGVVRGNDHGWTSVTVLPPIAVGVLLVAAFIAWELRAPEPMLPMHLFRSRSYRGPRARGRLGEQWRHPYCISDPRIRRGDRDPCRDICIRRSELHRG
jgi:hypothetical protein